MLPSAERGDQGRVGRLQPGGAHQQLERSPCVGSSETTTFVRTRLRRARGARRAASAFRRSRTRPARLTRMSPVRIVRNGPAPVRRSRGQRDRRAQAACRGTRSSSVAPPPRRRSTSRSRSRRRAGAGAASSTRSSSSSSPSSKSSTSRPPSRGPGRRRPGPASRRRARPRRRRARPRRRRGARRRSRRPSRRVARLREGLDRAVGPRAHPHAEIDLAGRGRGSRSSRPARPADAGPRPRAARRPGSDTGSGAESTTVMPTPPSSAGRRTAIRGCSAPAIRFACTLAATRTPSSGASTVAPRSANCMKPCSPGRARRAGVGVGVRGGVGRAEVRRGIGPLGAESHGHEECCCEWECGDAGGHDGAFARGVRTGHFRAPAGAGDSARRGPTGAGARRSGSARSP